MYGKNKNSKAQILELTLVLYAEPLVSVAKDVNYETLAHVMLFQNQIIPQCDQALCCTKEIDVHLSQEGIGPLD